MAEPNFDIGGPKDSFLLVVGGTSLLITESYQIKLSFFQQPAAFSLRLGPKLLASEGTNDFRERVVGEILEAMRPGVEFELRANPQFAPPETLFAGRIDHRGSPSAEYTQVEIRGRDYMAQLFDSFIETDTAFSEKTYFELTRKVMNMAGLTEAKGFTLFAGKGARDYINPSRKQKGAAGGVTVTPQSATEIVEQVETNAQSGTGKQSYLNLKAKLGTRLYDFLQNNYKLGGLFLFSLGKTFLLTRPNVDGETRFQFYRRVTGSSRSTNIITHDFQDDTSQRHSSVRVYGRSGGGKAGRNKLKAECVDEEMVAFGFDTPLVMHDADVKTNTEAAFVARRTVAEERRSGYRLSYVVAGHTGPSMAQPGARWLYRPDDMVNVLDDELNIHTRLWIESVTFNRNPHCTTTIELCFPDDLVFSTADMSRFVKSEKKLRSLESPDQILAKVK